MAAAHGGRAFDEQFSYEYILRTLSQTVDPRFYAADVQALMESNGYSTQPWEAAA